MQSVHVDVVRLAGGSHNACYRIGNSGKQLQCRAGRLVFICADAHVIKILCKDIRPMSGAVHPSVHYLCGNYIMRICIALVYILSALYILQVCYCCERILTVRSCVREHLCNLRLADVACILECRRHGEQSLFGFVSLNICDTKYLPLLFVQGNFACRHISFKHFY